MASPSDPPPPEPVSPDGAVDGDAAARPAEPEKEASQVSSAAAAPTEAGPKRPKKKRAKDGTTASGGAPAAEADDGQFGATRAIAALPGAGTPDGETLRDAWVAFEVGDYAKARELAGRLARSEDAAVARAAEDVLRRTGIDQVQIAFLVACALAILTIAWIYVPH